LTTTWSQVGGPGLVTFGDAHAIDTTASFTLAGTYVLRLTASDGELYGLDFISFDVTGIGSAVGIDIQVAASSDDAEQGPSGGILLDSPDLDMMNDFGNVNSAVGVRFNGIPIPHGATVVNAYLQFTADEADSAATSLTIEGQDADNAETFIIANSNISNRPRTTASVNWSPDPWLNVGMLAMPREAQI
jgi:hypothetical protein